MLSPNDPYFLLFSRLREKKLTVSFAESCTGGALAANITKVPGISEVFSMGIVAYSNAAKHTLLGVPHTVLSKEGAVSDACVRAMLQGLVSLSGAKVAASVSGIAGPSGGTPAKPVGTVWIAYQTPTLLPTAELLQLNGSREEIIQSSCKAIIDRLLRYI